MIGGNNADEWRKDGAGAVDLYRCDLTRIFEHESRSIYIDDCCHINDYGNHLMAESIFETIRDDFAARPCSPRAGDDADRPSSRECRRSLRQHARGRGR